MVPFPCQKLLLIAPMRGGKFWYSELCKILFNFSSGLEHSDSPPLFILHVEIHLELDAGLFCSGECDAGAVVFFREVEDLEEPALDGLSSQLEKEEKEGDDSPDSEDQQMLAGLKTKIATSFPEKVKVHTVSRNLDLTGLRRKAQPKYLKDLCAQFIAATSHQVLRSLRAQEGSLGAPHKLFQELTHQMALARERGQTPCWQQKLLDQVCARIKQDDWQAHRPVVIHGPPGCGKTTVLCHLCEAVHAVLGRETVVVLRLLGTSQFSSSLEDLLHSICLQVCMAMGLPPLASGRGLGSSVLCFHSLLRSVSRQGTQSLVLILDSVEELSSPRDACGAFWIPKACPAKVHLVFSTLLVENNVPRKVTVNPEDCFEVGPLSQKQVGDILVQQLASAKRRLRPDQQALLHQSFLGGGHALPVALAISEAQRWASYTPLSALEVLSCPLDVVHRLCGQLEQVHGPVLVGHALSYLVCAR